MTLTAMVPVAPAAPLGPYDECADSAFAANPCLRVDAAPAGRTYYLWLATYRCLPYNFSPDCRGLPNGGAVVAGILYQETNRVDGLQREGGTFGGTFTPPDKIVLA